MMVVSSRFAEPRPRVTVDRIQFVFLGQSSSAADFQMTAEAEQEQLPESVRSRTLTTGMLALRTIAPCWIITGLSLL